MNIRFISISETADLMRVSVSTLRRLIKAGSFPVHHFGRQVRIDRHDLARFIDGSRVTTHGQT